jgi:hypothetical protein
MTTLIQNLLAFVGDHPFDAAVIALAVIGSWLAISAAFLCWQNSHGAHDATVKATGQV